MSRTIEEWNSFVDEVVNILKRVKLLFGAIGGAIFGYILCIEHKVLCLNLQQLRLLMVSRLETHFCESPSQRFQVSSRSQRLQVSVTACCLETVNVPNKWLSKTSIIQRFFCSLHLQARSNQNRWENARNPKKINLEMVTIFYWDVSEKSSNYESRLSVSVSNFKSRVLVSELLMKSRCQSWGFNEVSVLLSKFSVSTGSDCVGQCIAGKKL